MSARSGAAKLHLEGVARQLPQGGAPPAGQPAVVVALALKRIAHLRQAVFKVKPRLPTVYCLKVYI